jgi:NAD(P)-dependent dehydrogenase (short-subunit alcohol dehydrogenase family)
VGTINIVEAFHSIAEEGFALVNVASMAGHMLPGWLVPTSTFPVALSDPRKLLQKLLFRIRLVPGDFYRRGMAYSVSKNFVIWYSKVSAARFGEKGARILSVSPGTFDTQMGRLEKKSGSFEMIKDAALKRPGRPGEIAELLAFCASEKAGYMTGMDILCDGGAMAGKDMNRRPLRNKRAAFCASP